jgi:hypothetical protein
VRAGTYVLTAHKLIDGTPERGHRDVTITAGATADGTVFISPDETHRMFNVVGIMTELRDIDINEDDVLSNVPIEYHLAVNPATPDVCAPEFNPCIDEVRLRVRFCAHLDRNDLKTLRVTAQQSLFELTDPFDTACDRTGAPLSDPTEIILGPGGSGTFDDGGLSIPGEASATWSVVVSNTQEVFPP